MATPFVGPSLFVTSSYVATKLKTKTPGRCRRLVCVRALGAAVRTSGQALCVVCRRGALWAGVRSTRVKWLYYIARLIALGCAGGSGAVWRAVCGIPGCALFLAKRGVFGFQKLILVGKFCIRLSLPDGRIGAYQTVNRLIREKRTSWPQMAQGYCFTEVSSSAFGVSGRPVHFDLRARCGSEAAHRTVHAPSGCAPFIH